MGNLQEIKAAFDAGLEQIKGLLNTQEAEIKKYGASTDQTAKKLTDAQEEFKKVAEDLLDFKNRLTEVEKRSGRLGANDRDLEEQKTLGEQFTQSEAFKNMLTRKSYTSDPMDLKSFFPRETRAIGSTGVSSLIVPRTRIAEIIAPARRKLHIRDLMNTRPISDGAVEYVKETGYSPITAKLNAAAALNAVSLVVDNAVGFYIGQKITLGNAASIYTVSGVTLSTNTITIPATGLTIAAGIGITVNSATFAGTAEGNVKPLSDLTFDLKTSAVKTIAHAIPIPRQVINDIPAMQGYTDDRLTVGLADIEDYHLLFGDGSSTQLDGIMTDANRQTFNGAAGIKVDSIRKAITKALIAEYQVTGVVLNHQDWEDIQLLKGSDGHYLYMNIPDGAGGQMVWGVPILPTNAMPPGRFCVGAFDLGTILWDREQANVRVAEQHADFFIKNMVLLLAEERLVQTVVRPEAFVDGTF
jgi:Phage capsid family